VARPLNLQERELPLDPYVYGYWLGKGVIWTNIGGTWKQGK